MTGVLLKEKLNTGSEECLQKPPSSSEIENKI